MSKKSPRSEADQSLLACLSFASRATPAGKLRQVRAALEAGANVNCRGDYGLTPLHYACSGKDLEVASVLVEAGANVSALSDAGVVPLISAVERNDDAKPAAIERSLALIDLLVKHGARLPNKTPLADFACAAVPVVEKLWGLGADPRLRNEHGLSAIHAVAQYQRPRLLKVLLDRGITTGQLDALGRSPLTIAEASEDSTPRQKKARTEVIALLASAKAPEGRGHRTPAGLDPTRLKKAATRATLDVSARRLLALKAASAEDLLAQLKRKARAQEILPLLPVLEAALGTKARRVKGLSVNRPQFFSGDLTVDGDLKVAAPLAVTGSLSVKGVVFDAGHDSLVAIGGNLEAAGLCTDGDFACRGQITVREALVAHHNDHTLSALSIHARLVIADDHDVQARVEAEVYFDLNRYAQGRGRGVARELRATLVDDVFDDDGRLDRDTLFARISRREAVFRKARR